MACMGTGGPGIGAQPQAVYCIVDQVVLESPVTSPINYYSVQCLQYCVCV